MSYNVKYGKGVFMKCSNLTGDINYLMGMLSEEETVISESLFSGFSGATGALVIPERITKIENNAFYGCSGITSITFEGDKNLKSIGNSAFYECSGLTGTLSIPNSVEQIGEYAFYKNTGLSALNLPSSLNLLGQYAFCKCNNLQGTINIPDSLEMLNDYTFSSCKELSKVVFESNGKKGVTKIEKYAFSQNTSLESVVFPNTLTSIGLWAFYGCRIQNLYLPNSLTNISNSSFNNCGSLNIIHWSENLKTIEGSAFYRCAKLTTLPNKDKITSIGETAFYGCTLIGSEGENDIIAWLEDSNITSVGNNCFNNCSKLTGDYLGTITNKNGVEIVINGAPFAGTGVKLTKVLDLEGKTSIAANEYACVTKFVDNSGTEITKITIPDTIKTIGSGAFAGCTTITQIDISNNVTSIGESAFANCTSLKQINLPENTSYTAISANLLNGCISLENIKIPKYITKIGDCAFMECNISSLNIPGNVKWIGGMAFANNYNLTSLTLNEGIQTIAGQFIRGAAITELTIPNSVTSLGNTCFHYCPKLKKITIGEGVKTIPNSLLDATNNVEEITIKGNITEIGIAAFANNVNLKTLNMNWQSVTKINSKAFANCNQLTGNVKLNASCSIAENAFQGCSLKVSK